VARKIASYLDQVNGAKTRQPCRALPTKGVNKKIFAREHGLGEALGLGIFGHGRGRGKEGILADDPTSLAGDLQRDDVAEQSRAEADLTRSGKRGLGELAASQQLLHGKLDFAGQLDGAGHVDHGARLGLDRGAGIQLQVQQGICVPKENAVPAPRILRVRFVMLSIDLGRL
jgi:hypothetical protein